MSRARLDEELVRRGLYASRARARDAVLRGTVFVNGVKAAKPAQGVSADDDIAVDDAAQHYVSRSALKLSFALDEFAVRVQGRQALDIGSSTGGFSQVLLERGAAHVTAIDVGHGQMVPDLATDERMSLHEGLNARDLEPLHLSAPVDLIVCDVSFISLTLALPPALQLAEEGATLVALIKPQFEVGKDGNPHDPDQQEAVCQRIFAFISGQGWTMTGLVPSPIKGGDGTQEFLMVASKNRHESSLSDQEQAQRALTAIWRV